MAQLEEIGQVRGHTHIHMENNGENKEQNKHDNQAYPREASALSDQDTNADDSYRVYGKQIGHGHRMQIAHYAGIGPGIIVIQPR